MRRIIGRAMVLMAGLIVFATLTLRVTDVDPLDGPFAELSARIEPNFDMIIAAAILLLAGLACLLIPKSSKHS